jgi:hypothetical protein
MPDPDPSKKQEDIRVLSGEEAAALAMEAVISGKQETVPLTKLLEQYQKGTAAERRFAEAHELKTSAEDALGVQRDLSEGLAETDPSKLRRAFKNSGATDSQLDEIFTPADTLRSTDSSSPGGQDAVGTQHSSSSLDGDERFDELVGALEEQRKQIEALQKKDEARGIQRKEQAVLREVDAALDKDEELSKLLAELDEGPALELRRLAYGKVGEASKTVPWGSAVSKGLKALKVTIAAWRGKGTLETGEGGSPAIGSMAGVGPSSHTVSQLHPSLKKEKLMPHDEGYEASLLTRMREKLARK